jgi:hypothetical protein
LDRLRENVQGAWGRFKRGVHRVRRSRRRRVQQEREQVERVAEMVHQRRVEGILRGQRAEIARLGGSAIVEELRMGGEGGNGGWVDVELGGGVAERRGVGREGGCGLARKVVERVRVVGETLGGRWGSLMCEEDAARRCVWLMMMVLVVLLFVAAGMLIALGRLMD